MKKILLLFVALIALQFSAKADTITYDFANDTYGCPRESGNSTTYLPQETVLTNGDATIVLSSTNTGKEMWRFWTGGLRATKSVVGVMDISVKNAVITSIKITNVLNTVYVAPEGQDASAIMKNYSKDFAFDNVETAKLTFTQTATISLSKLEITYEAATGDSKKTADLSFDEKAFTVYTDEMADFKAPKLNNPNNLDVTYSSSYEDVVEVNATTGAVTLTGELGTATITAEFAGNDQFRAGSASYTITVAAPLPKTNSISATAELADNTKFIVNYTMTVGFVNYSNVFARDASGNFIQIYGSNSYKVGDVIPAGWEGTYKLYNGTTPEIVPVGTLPEATENVGFTAWSVTGDDISSMMVNHVVKITDVTFAEATPSTKTNFTGTAAGVDLTFRNNYTIEGVEAGTYDVTVVVNVYNDAVQLYVISYDSKTSAIDDIAIDNVNAPAEYFNLQGIRVANPTAGQIVIRRQGNKVSKVLVR